MSSVNPNAPNTNPKTENTVLFHAIQRYLNNEELGDLNATLLLFVEICAHYRGNPRLMEIVQSIKAEFNESI